MRVPKPERGAVTEGACAQSKSGKHELVVVENPASTDTYLGKCRYCHRRIVRKND